MSVIKVEKVKVVVADNNNLLREGICALLRTSEEIDVVGEATNSNEIMEMVRKKSPNVVVMDMDTPIMGAEVARWIRKENSDIKVLFINDYENSDRIIRSLEAESNGYIPKKATASDLILAVLTAYKKGYFIHPSVAKKLFEYLRTKAGAEPDPYEQLGNREREVLKLIAEGYKSHEIAETLGIALKTVLGHRTSLMKKLGFRNRTELIKYAIRKQLIDLER